MGRIGLNNLGSEDALGVLAAAPLGQLIQELAQRDVERTPLPEEHDAALRAALNVYDKLERQHRGIRYGQALHRCYVDDDIVEAAALAVLIERQLQHDEPRPHYAVALAIARAVATRDIQLCIDATKGEH